MEDRSRPESRKGELKRRVSTAELKRQLSKQLSRQQSQKETEEEETAGGSLIRDEKAETGTVSELYWVLIPTTL